MGSYGNYGNEGDGGGYMMSSQQGGSQGGGGRNIREETLRPLTIKQILEADMSSDQPRIDGVPVTQATLVGQIRKLNPAQTMVMLQLDDGTGMIDVKHFIHLDKNDDVMADLKLDMYVRVFTRLKGGAGRPVINSHVLRPIADYNEVSYHMVEAAYVHLYLVRGLPGGGGGGAGGRDDADLMPVDGGGNGMDPQLKASSSTARRMFAYLKTNSKTNEGMHLQLISNGSGMGIREVMSAAEELLQLGVIYTTIDDETWAVLDD